MESQVEKIEASVDDIEEVEEVPEISLLEDVAESVDEEMIEVVIEKEIETAMQEFAEKAISEPQFEGEIKPNRIITRSVGGGFKQKEPQTTSKKKRNWSFK